VSDPHTHRAIAQIEETLRKCGLLSFSGEAQLLEWSKSTSRDGPKIKLLLPDDDAVVPFQVATVRKGGQAGQLYHLFAIRIEEGIIERSGGGVAPGADQLAGTKVASAPGNPLARKLHLDGYFRNPKLWKALHQRAIYTQEQHKAEIEVGPCLFTHVAFAQNNPGGWLRAWGVSGWGVLVMDLDLDMECQGDVCLHHVTGAALPAAGPRSSNPRKPPHFYGVPLCFRHHNDWAHGSGPQSATREQKEKLREIAIAITAHKVREVMKRWLGIDSLRHITQDMLERFEAEVYRD